jgi:hypothetical protein
MRDVLSGGQQLLRQAEVEACALCALLLASPVVQSGALTGVTHLLWAPLAARAHPKRRPGG